MLIEADLKGRRHALEDLKGAPEVEAKRLRRKAPKHVPGKLAEVQVKAHLVQVLNDA